MTPFEFAQPSSLAAAIALLDPEDSTIRPVAGGTALMLMMKAGVFRPAKLVSLGKIESRYSAITATADGLTIGAMATLSALERSEEIKRHAPVLIRTLLTLSNVRVRNVATVGGAVAHGDPHMDLPPVLMALGATITIVGADGQRNIAIEDFFSGYYETVLAKDELIASVHVPARRGMRAAYLKVTTGSVDDWPALGVAVALQGSDRTITSVRIVASAATEKAARLKTAEAVLAGNPVDERLVRRAADAAADEAELIADVRGSIPYKRELMRVYVQRAVRAAWAGGGTANGHD
jgi:carbon-monoxide dehydrogenase medium subunit